MSQVLSSTRIPVPNVDLLGPWLGDHGTLFIRTGNAWHVFDGAVWSEHTTRGLYATHKVRPPSNVDDGWLGIAPGPHSANWTKKELQTAMDRFMSQHADKYQRPDGKCWDPLNKARLLRINAKRREIPMTKAPADLPGRVRQDLMEV